MSRRCLLVGAFAVASMLAAVYFGGLLSGEPGASSGIAIQLSTIALANQQPADSESTTPRSAGSASNEENDENRRVKVTTWHLKSIFEEQGVRDLRHVTEIVQTDASGDTHAVSEEGLEQARNVILEQTRALKLDGLDTRAIQELAARPESIDAVARIFQQHPFEEIEKIAKTKKAPLELATADLMGRARRQMINHAMARAMQTFDGSRKYGLSIGMLDSGNKNSGIASDVDQTLFLIPPENIRQAMEDFGVKTESDLVKEVIKHFDAAFLELYKVTPARLGIECMNGADFFPDWRAKHTIGQFEIEVDRVVGEKRANPEAYRTEGELKSQAEGRGYDSLWEHSERVDHLQRLEAELEKLRQSPDGDAQKNARIKDFIEQYNKKKEFSHIQFDPADPDTSLARLKTEFERHSPWTEVDFDPANPQGEPRVTHLTDTRQKVLRMKPEMAKRFAFDGAWDNWLMFDHHPGNRPKYLLRSFAEGMSLLRSLQGQEQVKPLEYEQLYRKYAETGDARPLDDLLRQLYTGANGVPPTDAEIQKLRATMDVSAKARLLHKNELPGVNAKQLTGLQLEAKIYEEFMPPRTDAERLYNHTPEILQQSRLEGAKKAWEERARTMMIENLKRTVTESARAWDTGISEQEIADLKARGFDVRHDGEVRPHDTLRAKHKAAVEKSLFHGFHDLLGFSESGKNSLAFARALLEADPQKKTQLIERARAEGDLAMQLLDNLRATGSNELVRQAEWILRDAAIARLAVEPDSVLRSDRFRDFAYYDRVLEMLKRLPISEETYKRAVANFESGHYSPELLAQRMLRAGSERGISAIVEMGRAFGGNINDVRIYWPIMAENRFPEIEIDWGQQKFSGSQALTNLLTSAGNYDSVAQVIYEYQLHGPEQAKWALAREMFMNVPYVAQGNAIYDLLAHGRPQGAVMLGSAMYVPVLGQAYIVISLSTTTVAIIGNAYLMPLDEDLITKTYMGYIPKTERSWTDALLQRPGWKEDEMSRRESILYRVRQDVVATQTKTEEGEMVPVFHLASYSKSKAFDLDFIESTLSDDYEYLLERDLLGGGPQYQELKTQAQSDHRARFESQRAGMFYHYEERLIKFLRTAAPDDEGEHYTVHEGDHMLAGPWLEIDEPEKVFEHLATFCGQVVRDWINAEGDYNQLDENVLLDTRFDADMRKKLALRIAQDLARSYQILRGGSYSKESEIKSRCRKALTERRALEANQRTFGLLDARTAEETDEYETLASLGQVFSHHKNALRIPAPHIHVRPRVILQQQDSQEKPREVVQLLVSVVANDDSRFAQPDEVKHPGPFDYNQKSFVEDKKLIVELTVYDAVGNVVVHALDAKGNELPYSWRGEIGSIGEAEEGAGKPLVHINPSHGYGKFFKQRREYFLQLAEPANLRQLPPYKENPELFEQVYGFNFYRRFDKPQPDEDLRFKPGPYGTGHVLPNEPDAVYRVQDTAGQKIQRIGTFSWVVGQYRPPATEGNSYDLGLRPMDPSDPRVPRWYAYTVLTYKGPPQYRFQPKPEDLVESPLSPWVYCEVEPVLCYGGQDGKLLATEPDKTHDIALGTDVSTPSVGVCAFLKLDGKRQIPKYLLDYRRLLPDAQPRYVYKFQFEKQDRYAIFRGFGDDSQAREEGRRQIQHQPPGKYPLHVSIRIGEQDVVGKFQLVRSADRNWESAQQGLARETERFNQTIARIKQNARTSVSTPPGLTISGTADAYRILARTYFDVADFKTAEEHAKTAVEQWRQAAEIYEPARREDKFYDQLADIYYAADKPQEYLQARNAQLGPINASMAEGRNSSALTIHYRHMADEYFNMTGDVARAREYFQQSIDSAPAGRTAGELPPELWDNPLHYRRDTAEQPHVEPQVLDPDPLLRKGEELPLVPGR